MKNKKSLALQFGVLFLLFALVTTVISGFVIYEEMTDTYHEECVTDLNKFTQHVVGLMKKEGTESLKQELREAGFHVTEEPEDAQCIVMGFDTELTFKKLEDVCRLLFTKEDIPYIATHPDYTCIVEFGLVPDLGCVCDMIYKATGKRPIIVGKPQPLIPELAMKKCGCTKEETVFVGDQMDTDIPCGLNAGVTTLLVMTGETTQEKLDAAERKPTMVLKNAGEILQMI